MCIYAYRIWRRAREIRYNIVLWKLCPAKKVISLPKNMSDVCPILVHHGFWIQIHETDIYHKRNMPFLIIW